VVISGSQNVEVTRSIFTRPIIDGVNIALSLQGAGCGNSFTAFNSGEAHPDAVQAWSRPGNKPTSDIVVEDNRDQRPHAGHFVLQPCARRDQ